MTETAAPETAPQTAQAQAYAKTLADAGLTPVAFALATHDDASHTTVWEGQFGALPVRAYTRQGRVSAVFFQDGRPPVVPSATLDEPLPPVQQALVGWITQAALAA